MNFKLLLLLFTLLHLGQCAKRPSLFPSFRPLQVRVRYAKLCDDNTEDSTAENITLLGGGTSITVNAVGTLARQIESIEKLNVIFRKCNDAAEDRNCEIFTTWRFGKEACSMMGQKNMVWSGITLAFHPTLKCPLVKGVYHIDNAQIDTKLLQQLFIGVAMEKYFWRNRVEVHDHRMFLCFDYGFDLFPSKH